MIEYSTEGGIGNTSLIKSSSLSSGSEKLDPKEKRIEGKLRHLYSFSIFVSGFIFLLFCSADSSSNFVPVESYIGQ